MTTTTATFDYSDNFTHSVTRKRKAIRSCGGDAILRVNCLLTEWRSAMRVIHVSWVFMVAICASADAYAQSVTKADADAFEAYVLQTWEQYSEYMNEGNVDDWLEMWDVNGVQLAPGTPASEGIAEITASITTQHAAFDFEQFKIINKEVEVQGDLGFARGNYSFAATPKDGGDQMQFEGKYLTIFKRQADGGWRIYRDCFNPNS